MRFVQFKRETFTFAVVPDQVAYLATNAEEDGTRICFTGGDHILVSGSLVETANRLLNR